MIILTALLLMGGLKTNTVFAQSPEFAISPAASGAYLRGVAAAGENDWKSAIKYFGQAWSEARTWPDVLYNIGYSHQQNGGHELIAIAWYQAYLTTSPAADDADQVREWIVELEVKVELRVKSLINKIKKISSMNISSLQDYSVIDNLAGILAKLADIDGAREEIEHTNYEYTKAAANAEIAISLARAGDISEAKKTALLTNDNIIAYTEIVRAQAENGDIVGARETISLCNDDDPYGIINMEIVVALADNGDIAGARETALLWFADDPYYLMMAYVEIGMSCTRAGNTTGYSESIALAREAAVQITDEIWQQDFAYEFIAEAQAKAGDSAEANENVARITDEERKSSAYQSITEFQIMAKEIAFWADLRTRVKEANEIESWTNLASRRLKRFAIVVDWQKWLEELEDKDNTDNIFWFLVTGADNLAEGLEEIRNMETRWQGKRAIHKFQEYRPTTLLEDHTDSVETLMFHPDGKRVISAGFDRTIRIWNLDSLNEVQTLSGHIDWIHCLALHPDLNRFATAGGDETIRFWNLESSSNEWQLPSSNNVVSFLSIHPDGKRFFEGGGDNIVRIRDIKTGDLIQEFKGFEGKIQSGAMSSDGTILAAGDWDGNIRVWEVETGNELMAFKGHHYIIHSIAFSPDGNRFCSAGDGTVKVWNLKSGELEATFSGDGQIVDQAVFSPDGEKIIFVEIDGIIRICDLELQKVVFNLVGHATPVNCIAISPNGRKIVSGDLDGKIYLWDWPVELQ